MTIREAYNLYRDRLLFFAWNMVGVREDAEDIVSGVFEKACKAGDVNKTFLHTLTKNDCLNHLKRKKVIAKFDYWLEEENVTNLYMRTELLDILNKAIQESLTPTERKVFVLWCNDFSSKEISVITGATEHTVRNHIGRAKEKMREVIGGKNYVTSV